MRTLAFALVPILLATSPARAQEPAAAPAPAPASPPSSLLADLSATIGRLGAFDYAVRMNAARAIRRLPPAQAVPALVQAVRAHEDEYVRHRAFVILTSFNDRGTPELVRWAIGDRNERLRETAYKWLERHPDPQMTAQLLSALQSEQAEFVRPALVGALAALGRDPQVQRVLVGETARGLDVFRSAVIDALGRHRAAYALDAIAAVARQDGPLQNDALIAIGRIGDPRGLAVLRAITPAAPDAALALHGAYCLLGEDCDQHIKALSDAASAADASRSIVRAATETLAAVASAGHDAALNALYVLAARGGALRDHAVIGLATAAVRSPEAVFAWLDRGAGPARAAGDGRQDPVRDYGRAAVEMLKEGFEFLEEDFAEEQFFAVVRASYWKAPEASPSRTLAALLIQELEF